MGGTVTAVISLAIAVVLAWRRRAPKVVALLALVAGAGITSGTVGRLIRQTLDTVTRLVGDLTTQAVGAAVPSVLAVVLVVLFFHDLLPRSRASRATAVNGLFLPAVATSLPGAAGAFVVSLIGMVGTLIAGLVGAVFGGR